MAILGVLGVIGEVFHMVYSFGSPPGILFFRFAVLESTEWSMVNNLVEDFLGCLVWRESGLYLNYGRSRGPLCALDVRRFFGLLSNSAIAWPLSSTMGPCPNNSWLMGVPSFSYMDVPCNSCIGTRFSMLEQEPRGGKFFKFTS